MTNQPKLTPLDRARHLARYTLFVAKWAFYIFFVCPSVSLCSALALYSNFSFQTIPREILEFAAQTANNPPAQPGSLSIQVCQDKIPARALPASPICQSKGLEQRPIEALARDLSERLWLFYAIVVTVAGALAIGLGLFDRDRAALRRRLAS
ncbi:hypothetical protein [Burkholderia cepacia]|uniref:hypothetical protein n=1 Tax=Burkholderia cepacia TaxID=292 RepID=UPI0007591F8C|nr:hypothetical protein [Burkholderia cepacia]KVS70132.1 hypothetical protein WK41_19600 [Burkholderia cepacia]